MTSGLESGIVGSHPRVACQKSTFWKPSMETLEKTPLVHVDWRGPVVAASGPAPCARPHAAPPAPLARLGGGAQVVGGEGPPAPVPCRSFLTGAGLPEWARPSAQASTAPSAFTSCPACRASRVCPVCLCSRRVCTRRAQCTVFGSLLLCLWRWVARPVWPPGDPVPPRPAPAPPGSWVGLIRPLPLCLVRRSPCARLSREPPRPPSTAITASLSSCPSWTRAPLRPSTARRSSAAAAPSPGCRRPAVARGSRGCLLSTLPSPPGGRCPCRLSESLPRAVSEDPISWEVTRLMVGLAVGSVCRSACAANGPGPPLLEQFFISVSRN